MLKRLLVGMTGGLTLLATLGAVAGAAETAPLRVLLITGGCCHNYPVIWINQYGRTRVFGTTFGHSDDTFRDPVFLQYVSRGLLWAAGRLEK